MGPPSYMRSVVDRNVVIRHMTVLVLKVSVISSQLSTILPSISYAHPRKFSPLASQVLFFKLLIFSWTIMYNVLPICSCRTTVHVRPYGNTGTYCIHRQYLKCNLTLITDLQLNLYRKPHSRDIQFDTVGREFGPINIDSVWRIRSNMEIDKLIEGADIVRFIKAQRIKWLGHIPRTANGPSKTN